MMSALAGTRRAAPPDTLASLKVTKMTHSTSGETGAQSLLDTINAQIPASDFQAEYFPNGMVQVTMNLPADLVEQVRTLAADQDWPEADALAAMLGYAVGCLKEERAHKLIEQNDQPARDQLDLMLKQMRDRETQYAVMKFRTWNFLQAFQSASLSRGALTNQVRGLSGVVAELRAENEALKREISSLQTQCSQLQASHDHPPANGTSPSVPSSPTLWRRLVSRWTTEQG